MFNCDNDDAFKEDDRIFNKKKKILFVPRKDFFVILFARNEGFFLNE